MAGMDHTWTRYVYGPVVAQALNYKHWEDAHGLLFQEHVRWEDLRYLGGGDDVPFLTWPGLDILCLNAPCGEAEAAALRQQLEEEVQQEIVKQRLWQDQAAAEEAAAEELEEEAEELEEEAEELEKEAEELEKEDTDPEDTEACRLMPFLYKGTRVRAFLDAQGEPWWMAQDVGEALGIVQVRSTLRDFPVNEKGVQIVHTSGGPREMVTLNEPGLYRLIFQSHKPEAEDFKTWVLHKVLPALRRKGYYAMPGVFLEEDLEEEGEDFQQLRVCQTMLNQLVVVKRKQRALDRKQAVIQAEQQALQATQMAIRDAVLEQHSQMIVALQESREARVTAKQADAKADLALANTQYLSIREFISSEKLWRQCPESTWPRLATWLKDYCFDNGVHPGKREVYGKPWETEKTYPRPALQAMLKAVMHQPQQITLVK